MKTIEFEFDLLEKVKINGIESMWGFIVAYWVSDMGIQYRVVYYCDGERKMEYFFGFELSKIKDQEKLGFKI